MAFRTWRVKGPSGARVIWTFRAAVDHVAQEIKTAALTVGLSETDAEDQAWGAVRNYAEAREPFAVSWRGQTFAIERRTPK